MNKRRCGVGVAVLGKLVKAIFILIYILSNMYIIVYYVYLWDSNYYHETIETKLFLDNMVYAIGGHDGTSYLQTVSFVMFFV